MRPSSPAHVAAFLAGAVLLRPALLPAPGALGAQAPTFSSTLRYGTGYLDVPAALVLPNLALRANYSGFLLDVSRDPEVDASGAVIGPGEARSGFRGDASFSVGLLDRFEVGTTVQSFSADAEGGHLMGVFGKALLLDPSRSRLGLAMGARYLGGPDFGDGVERAPTRLGFPDRRARSSFADGRALDTNLSVFGVASLFLPGLRFPGLAENQVNLSFGYGTGMFGEGGDLSWYAPEGTGGWFFAGGWELSLGPGTVLGLRVEHNGFDVNAGAELAWKDARVGVHGLGLNHGDGSSVYRSRKLGFSISLTACPLLNRACRPGPRALAPPDTVRLPAPPPDTVEVVRLPVPPGTSGRPVQLCLATGEDRWALITAAGDTLVGPDRVPVSSRPPGERWPGAYALDTDWFEPGAVLEVGGWRFRPEGDPWRPACAWLRPWAEVRGVSLFQGRDGEDPPRVIHLPLAPGVWQRYRREG